MFKSRKFKVILITLALLLCVFCTSVTAVAFYVYNSNNNIPYASDLIERVENRFLSEDQFDQIVVNTLKATINEERDYKIPADFNGMQSDFSLTLNSAYESYDLRLIGKGTTSFSKLLDGSLLETNLTLDIADMQFGSDVEIRSFQNGNSAESFVKLNNIPAFLTLMVPGIDQLNNKWISVPTNETSNFDIDDADKSNLIELVNSQEFRGLISRAPDRVFGEVRAYCVSFSMDEVQLDALNNRYESIANESLYEDLESIETFEIKTDLCFGRRSELPYFFEMSFSTDEVNLNIKLDNFNYPETEIIITKPESAEDLNKLLSSF